MKPPAFQPTKQNYYSNEVALSYYYLTPEFIIWCNPNLF